MNMVDFKDRTCQQAITFSWEKYIPCGEPAVALVWNNGDSKAYFMCLGHADHNVRNRGGVLLATTDEGLRRDYMEPDRDNLLQAATRVLNAKVCDQCYEDACEFPDHDCDCPCHKEADDAREALANLVIKIGADNNPKENERG